MADPRGNGFNKHRGKWHAPRRQLRRLPNPIHYGWRYLYKHPDCGRAVYELNGCKLMPVNIRENHFFFQRGDADAEEMTGYTLMEITIEAKGDIPFNGEPASQPDELTLADSYGLEARG